MSLRNRVPGESGGHRRRLITPATLIDIRILWR